MSQKSSGGIGFFGLLFIVLLALKVAVPNTPLTWFWVFAPLWMPIALLLVIWGFLALVDHFTSNPFR